MVSEIYVKFIIKMGFNCVKLFGKRGFRNVEKHSCSLFYVTLKIHLVVDPQHIIPERDV